jgi:hypothetical protein
MATFPTLLDQPDSPGGTETSETADPTKDQDLASVVHELSEAAMAVTNYMAAAKQFRSRADAGSVDKIDAALSAAEQQAKRLRQVILNLRTLIGRTHRDNSR